jgi:hypothetical protein
MRSLDCFIVKPLGGKRYNNTKDIDGKDFILSSSQEDHTVTNREAVVVALPMRNYNGPIKVGDTVIVHHNMFRIYYDMKGRERSSSNHIVEDLYMLEQDMTYLYKSPCGEWKSPAPYCFVEPISKSTDNKLKSTGSYEDLWGVLVYKNEEQEDLSSGDMVSFKPESEYEFKIDDRVLYRMRTNSICLISENKY